ncbi:MULTISPECIES: cellulose biosynthesis cyclic di-GMP-binding regulatory protein BcsB [Methylobacterium]|uniref:cellulose biosynthesis cyclic di-GMP-binding regulatory protein BcsB n=1 Tax=Methylobacterium TaxID=407 RepID=UPI0013EA043D|nr:cellulose biosynthesis cyclic di-GMP-binding regulatory protein BcsB [Methylobacterium sp. DB0501]NGM34377.1 cellulose biosynthesis cyclic di-GMP-binding regulatory protein BcsB [Methylobacterium sp. DB0501]
MIPRHPFPRTAPSHRTDRPRARPGSVGWEKRGPAILALLLAALLAPPALAQSFLGTGPAERLTLPPTGEPLRTPPQKPPVPEADPARRGVPVAAAVAAARRFPAGTRGYRLAGEEASLQFPVYLTEAQARGQTKLRVSYLSAISVAPEASELSGSVNGTRVGWTRIQAPGAVKVVEFPLPEGLLKPGYNAVGLAASQRHRVDCSTGATYELWTQIDPSRSGLVVAQAGDLDLKTLAALEPDESGALPIAVLLAERPSPERLERMIGAVQAVALVARLARPAVTFGAPLSGRAGLNLLVGTAAEIRGTEGVEELGPITGPRVALMPPRGSRAPVLVVTGASADDLRQAIQTLATSGDAGGTPVGARTAELTRGYPVRGGESLTLDQFGVTSREFNGRLLRVGFEVRFPADFVPADYGKAMLHLAGGYAAGLDSSAQIVVDINGRNAASVPLPYGRGEVFTDSAIPLPLSLWRPGLNRVEISALLPTAADRTCDTLAPAARRARFLFLDRTRLDVPALARAVRSPDLAAVKAGAVPFLNPDPSIPGPRPRLVLPTPDRDSTSAAATLAARLAIAAGRVIDFEIGSDDRAAGGGARLVVAPVRALTPAALDSVGLDPGQVRSIWEGRAETVATPGPFGAEGVVTLDRLRRNLPMRCALPAFTTPLRTAAAPAPAATPVSMQAPLPPQSPAGAAQAPAGPPDDSEADLVARWDESARGVTIPAVLANAWTALSRWSAEARDLGLRAAGGPAPEAVPLNPRASLIIAQGDGTGGRLEDGTVLVTAPNASMLRASVSCLVDPVVWTGLTGQAAFLDASDGSLTTVQPRRVGLIETQGRGLANLRLVAAAWLSLNPGAYVAMTLVMALCLGLATTSLVRQLGRRNP